MVVFLNVVIQGTLLHESVFNIYFIGVSLSFRWGKIEFYIPYKQSIGSKEKVVTHIPIKCLARHPIHLNNMDNGSSYLVLWQKAQKLLLFHRASLEAVLIEKQDPDSCLSHPL